MTTPKDVKLIKLSKGKFAVVDAKNFNELNKFKWSFDGKYAQRKEYLGTFAGKKKFKSIRMHRQIMNAPDGVEIDHEDGEGTHNWEDNLRKATHEKNMYNMKSHSDSTSKYKGVCWNKKAEKWEVQINRSGKRVFHKYFSDEIEAARAYNKAAEIHHMAFARPNPLPD